MRSKPPTASSSPPTPRGEPGAQPSRWSSPARPKPAWLASSATSSPTTTTSSTGPSPTRGRSWSGPPPGSTAAVPAGGELAANTLREFAGPGETATDLAASFARAHGVLDLVPDDDTRTIAALLAGAGSGSVVLTSEQEGAYKRFTGRALAMFHLNDPLARSLYRGTDR